MKILNYILCSSPEYIDGQKAVLNRKEIIDTYKAISIKYKIPFLDYSNSQISQRKELFYNVLHLNKSGSELFSRQLASDLKAVDYSSKYIETK